ncbi:hypothetical protein M885DRAFT_14515 [Pelagophyceae sp. CCMP2097]|nr:hypothetical protein M885DRAFT_14515 [Pelagophyceae sp. CCMP2097]
MPLALRHRRRGDVSPRVHAMIGPRGTFPGTTCCDSRTTRVRLGLPVQRSVSKVRFKGPVKLRGPLEMQRAPRLQVAVGPWGKRDFGSTLVGWAPETRCKSENVREPTSAPWPLRGAKGGPLVHVPWYTSVRTGPKGSRRSTARPSSVQGRRRTARGPSSGLVHRTVKRTVQRHVEGRFGGPLGIAGPCTSFDGRSGRIRTAHGR